MPFRREVKPNRQQTLPIESSHPPRLPPSEVCQRGPPSLGGSRNAAARIEKPSGKETFAAINTNVRYGVERKNTRSSLSGNAVIGKTHGQKLRSSFSLRNFKFYQII
jgi:hypothetical protein